MYVMVVVSEGKIDGVKNFDDLADAKFAADEAAEEFDLDYNPGDVGVFETDPKTSAMKLVYSPEIGDEDEDEDEDGEDEDGNDIE